MDEHQRFLDTGNDLHEARKYARALPWYEKALTVFPGCPDAIYSRANTLHMLNRHAEAREILLSLVATPDAALRSGCPASHLSQRSLYLDSFNLLFRTTLYTTKSWKKAVPFLHRHLKQRAPGVRSIWSKAEILREAEELRVWFAPRERIVTGRVATRDTAHETIAPGTRTGLRIVGSRGNPVVHRALLRYAWWLRQVVEFPIRVPVYRRPEARLVTTSGGSASATFFAPWNRSVEPHIRIATGDYAQYRREVGGRDNALFGYLVSLSHEVVHYRQWIETGDMWERGVARRANALVDQYALTTDHP